MNINTKAGRASLKGAELHGEEAKEYLEQGHAVWVNDTYWLLMRYKMKDPAHPRLRRRGEEGQTPGTSFS